MTHYLDGMPPLANPLPSDTAHVWMIAETGELILTDNGIYGAVLEDIGYRTPLSSRFLPRDRCTYIGTL